MNAKPEQNASDLKDDLISTLIEVKPQQKFKDNGANLTVTQLTTKIHASCEVTELCKNMANKMTR